jgi:hypothetical protein
LKKISIFSLSIMLFILICSPVYAETQKNNVLYQATEIKDIDSLLKRAKSGLSDVTENTVNFDGQVIKNIGDKKENNHIKTYTTTQKLKVEKLYTGETVEHYATTKIALINSDGSQYGEQYDESVGVKAYSTIYWNYTTVNNITYTKLVSATGGWTIEDSQLYVTGKRVRLGATGMSPNRTYTEQYQDFYPSGTTFSYNANTSWYPIQNDGFDKVGASSFCTVNDISSSWQLTLINNF